MDIKELTNVKAQAPPLRLYLDTQPLVASQWPSASADLHALVAVAKSAGVPVIIPSAVEMELEAQFIREYREKQQAVSAAVRKLDQHRRRAGLASVAAPATPTDEEIRASYRVAVDTSKAFLAINSIALSSRSAAEYFQDLLFRQAPFSPSGAGLGDAMITWSVIDDLISVGGGTTGLLVSADKDYSGVSDLAAKAGVSLTVMAIPDADKHLIGRLATDLAERYEITYDELNRLIKEQFRRVEHFVTSNLEVPASSLGFFFDTPRTIERIEILAISRIHTKPQLWQEIPVDAVVEVTIVLKVALHVEVSAWPKTEPTMLRVGETQDRHETSITVPMGPVKESRVFERDVEVTASVTRGQAGFEKLALKDAKLKSSPASLEGLLRAIEPQS